MRISGTRIVCSASWRVEEGVGSQGERFHFQAEEAWVAVKELKLSYYFGETLLFTMYTHYGNLI